MSSGLRVAERSYTTMYFAKIAHVRGKGTKLSGVPALTWGWGRWGRRIGLSPGPPHGPSLLPALCVSERHPAGQTVGPGAPGCR